MRIPLNRLISVAALSALVGLGPSALAQTTTISIQADRLSRGDVVAELMRAYASGELGRVLGEYGERQRAFRSMLARSDVHAELFAALSDGHLSRILGEYGAVEPRFVSTRSRGEVHAELIRAFESGALSRIPGEYGRARAPLVAAMPAAESRTMAEAARR